MVSSSASLTPKMHRRGKELACEYPFDIGQEVQWYAIGDHWKIRENERSMSNSPLFERFFLPTLSIGPYMTVICRLSFPPQERTFFAHRNKLEEPCQREQS